MSTVVSNKAMQRGYAQALIVYDLPTTCTANVYYRTNATLVCALSDIKFTVFFLFGDMG